MTTAEAVEFTTGDIALRPGFGERLTNWMKSKREAAPAAAEMPDFDARTRYDLGLSDIADDSKLNAVADLGRQAVMARMAWIGVR